MLYKNRYLYLILMLFTFLISCGDDRSSSVTGGQNSATSGAVTLSMQVSRTKVGLGEIIDLTMQARCNSCAFGPGDWPFSYTSNSKIDASSGSTSYTIDDGESSATMAVNFQGIEATVRGTAVITGTFSTTSNTVSVSTEVTIE